MECKSVCSICGEQFPVDALISFAGEHFCEHCLNEETIAEPGSGMIPMPGLTITRSASGAMTALTRPVSAAGGCFCMMMPVI